VGGNVLLAIDEIKKPKEGRRMPGCRSHHQSSTNNSKPEFIMGHSVMMIGLIVKNAYSVVGLVPLMSRIIGGIRFSPKDKKTNLDKSVESILELATSIGQSVTVVGDALYCVGPFAKRLFENGINTISRIKGNGVAYYPADPATYSGRGRRPKYGAAVKFNSLFDCMSNFCTAASPIPGEQNIEIKYLQIYLIPKWFGQLTSFVLVAHPKRGKIILPSAPLGNYLFFSRWI